LQRGSRIRRHLTAPEDAYTISLGTLSVNEATELLIHLSGGQN